MCGRDTTLLKKFISVLIFRNFRRNIQKERGMMVVVVVGGGGVGVGGGGGQRPPLRLFPPYNIYVLMLKK